MFHEKSIYYLKIISFDAGILHFITRTKHGKKDEE